MENSLNQRWRWALFVGLLLVAVVFVLGLLEYSQEGGFIEQLCADDFMPHGHCYFWRPEILWLHVISDTVVALSYFAIPVCLVALVRKRKGLRFQGVFWLFSLFILFCGLTHALEIYSVWHGAYRLTGIVKAATAVTSIATAVYLVRNLPMLSKIPLPTEYEEVEQKLGARERIFDAILSGAGEGFVTVRASRNEEGALEDFLVDEVNETAAREMRVEKSEAEGKGICEVFSFAEELNLRKRLEEAYSLGATRLEEVEFKTSDGNSRWLVYKIVPAGDLLALFFDDVSKERSTELKLQKALEEQASEAKRESSINAARAEAAMAAAVHGILIVDDSGKIVQCNKQLLDFFGYEEEELIGQSVEVLVPSESRGRHQGYREDFHGNPQKRRMGSSRRLEGRRKDGSSFPVEVGLNPFETPEGKFVSASVLDITERIEARVALEESELRFQQAATGGNVGIWHWFDIMEEKQFWSRKLYELIGYESGEIESTYENFKKLLHPDDFKATLNALKECFGNKSMFSHDYRLLTKNNGYRWFYATGMLAIDSNTGKTRMVGSIQDIQGRKDHEAQIQKVNEILEARNLEMEQMTYAVSHDLKAPLVSIRGLVNLLLNGGFEFSADTKEMLQRIEKSAKLMSDLIGDLLEMSRVGQPDEGLESVDIREVVGELEDLFSHELEKSACTLKVADDLPVLKANHLRIRQALQNLIANALNYACDAPGCEIRVFSERSESFVDLVVEDDGPGIPADCLESVFKLFKRLETRKEGTGLGLAIVAKIMSTSGGVAFVESEEGKGARFVLRFFKSFQDGGKESESSPAALEASLEDGPKMKFSAKDKIHEVNLSGSELSNYFRRFVYTAAHDFNSPLATIKGNLELLGSQAGADLDSDGRELILRSSKAANRMSHYLGVLVQYAEVLFEDGSKSEVDLRALLGDLVESLEREGSIPAGYVTFKGTFPVAKLHYSLVKALFANLIENSIACSTNETDPSVSIECQETETRLSFALEDRDSEISSNDISDVFVPFGEIAPLKEQRRRAGLAICKLIVEMHGGDISIDPDFTDGTRILFSILKS